MCLIRLWEQVHFNDDALFHDLRYSKSGAYCSCGRANEGLISHLVVLATTIRAIISKANFYILSVINWTFARQEQLCCICSLNKLWSGPIVCTSLRYFLAIRRTGIKPICFSWSHIHQLWWNDWKEHTPPRILGGREIRLPCNLVFGCRTRDALFGADCVTELQRRMNNIHQRYVSSFKLLATAWKNVTTSEESVLSLKLWRACDGPFRLTKRVNEINYRISKVVTDTNFIFYITRQIYLILKILKVNVYMFTSTIWW